MVTAVLVEEEMEMDPTVGLELVETEFVGAEESGTEVEVAGATEDIVMSMLWLIVLIDWVEMLVVSVTV